MSTITAAITAVGAYVPDFILSNQVLETMVDTNDEWITSRTGIKERRVLKGDGLGTSYLAIKAAQDLIKKSNRQLLFMLQHKLVLLMHLPMIYKLHVQDFYSECQLLLLILNQAGIKKYCL